MRKNAIAYGIGGALIVILSFSLTLWLTEPELPAPERIGLFKAATGIVDEASMNEAARAAGLKNSPYVRGAIDGLNRLDGNTVNISGWATETVTIVSKGAPVLLMAFSQGRNVLAAETKGARPDVTATLNLSPEASRDVAFSARLNCTPRAKLIVVAVSVSGTYNGIGTRDCP